MIKENCLMWCGGGCLGLDEMLCRTKKKCPFYKDKTVISQEEIQKYNEFMKAKYNVTLRG